METKYLKINPADNVVVAISDLKAGEAITVDGHAITLKGTNQRGKPLKSETSAR